MTPPDRIDARALGAIGYRKPAVVLLALRDNVVERATMDRAMREYAHRWAFRHPTPADFFRTVENVSGEDLAWFWNSFFYGTDVLDIGIERVTSRQEAGQFVAEVTLRRNTSVPFPVSIRLKLMDGTTQDVRLPVQIWATRADAQFGPEHFRATIATRGIVKGARLWPDPNVPDWNTANDAWGDAPPSDSRAASTAGGLATPIVGAPVRPNVRAGAPRR